MHIILAAIEKKWEVMRWMKMLLSVDPQIVEQIGQQPYKQKCLYL